MIRPDDLIDCAPGYIKFGSRKPIYDVHRYGTLSFTDVIVKSSNVGAIKVGTAARAGAAGPLRQPLRIRPDARARTSAARTRASSGTRCGSNDSALASVSMGYQVGVTPLQMAAAVSSVANGGIADGAARRPRIHQERPPRFRWRRRRCARRCRRRPSPSCRTIMEGVVERGTAKSAQIPGYTIAGKTGTAAKLVDGHYSKSEYNASFVGFLPSRQPALTIIVVIDSPHGNGYTGGVVAAPVFKRIAEASLRHLGIAPTVNPMPPVLAARHERGRRAGRSAGRRPTQRSRRRGDSTVAARCHAGSARAERARSAAHADEDRHVGANDRPRRCHRAVAGRRRTAVDRRGRRAPAGALSAGGHAGRRPSAMTLGVLLQEFADRSGVSVPPLEASAGTPVSSIAYDSRKARAGSVFVALRGVNADGTGFAREAIGRGAIATLSESAAPADVSAPWVQVPDARLALAALSAIFHDDPSERLILVGITGTNGKTTTSYLLGVDLRGRRHPVRTHRDRRLPHRPQGSRGGADHSRGPGAAGDAPRDGEPGLRRLRDGSVVARAGAEARRLSCASRPRSSRISRAITSTSTATWTTTSPPSGASSTLLPEQAVAVVNLDDRRAGQLTGIASRTVTYAIDAAADVVPVDLRSSLDGLTFDVRTPRGHGAHRVATGRPRQRLQHPGGGRCGCGARPAGRGDRGGHRQASRRAGQVSARLRQPRRRSRRGRLRAHRRRAEEPAGDGAAARAGPHHHGVRLRRRPRPHEAAR